jgi:hypothetical protein
MAKRNRPGRSRHDKLVAAFIVKVSELAIEADEAGLHNLSTALMVIVRGSRLPIPVVRRMINGSTIILEAIEAMKTR